MVILLLIAVVRTSPQWLATVAAARTARSNRNAERITDLEAEIKKCREDCDRETELLRQHIHGMERQRNSEQRAIVRAILQTISDPSVKKQLEMLESIQHLDTGVQWLGEVRGDSEGSTDEGV